MHFDSVSDALEQFNLCLDAELYEEARQALDQAEALDPGNPDVLWSRAYLAILQDELDQAAELLERYDEQYPDTIAGLYLRGLYCRYAQDYPAAVACFEHLLTEPDAPDQAEYLYHLAWCQDELDQNDDALAAIEACIALEDAPNPITWRLRLHLIRKMKDAAAVDEAEEAYCQTFPDDTFGLLLQGRRSMAQRHFNEAADAFRRVLQQYPGHPEAHEGLVEAIRERSWFARALEAVASFKGNNYVWWAIFLTLTMLRGLFQNTAQEAGYQAFTLLAVGLVLALSMYLPWAVPGLEVTSLWLDRYGRSVITPRGKVIAIAMPLVLVLGMGIGIAGAVANHGPLGFWGMGLLGLLPCLGWALLDYRLKPLWLFRGLLALAGVAGIVQAMAVGAGQAVLSYQAGATVLLTSSGLIGWMAGWAKRLGATAA